MNPQQRIAKYSKEDKVARNPVEEQTLVRQSETLQLEILKSNICAEANRAVGWQWCKSMSSCV